MPPKAKPAAKPAVKHTFPPITTPFGAVVTEVLVDGVGCHWEKNKAGDWKCKPNKGGRCDNKDAIDDGCRYERSTIGKGKEYTIIYECLCMNSIGEKPKK